MMHDGQSLPRLPVWMPVDTVPPEMTAQALSELTEWSTILEIEDGVIDKLRALYMKRHGS